MDRVEAAAAGAIDRFGERDRQVRHTKRVPGRRRIARFNRDNRRAHESFEELADFRVELAVLERDSGLRRQ